MRRFSALLATALLIVGVALIVAPAMPLAKSNPAPAPAAPKLPATILGLSVTQENIKNALAQETRELYVHGVWLYSLRQGKELMATLEIGKFQSSAPWQSSDFDISLAYQLGGSVPEVARVNGVPMYFSTARGIQLVAWFHGGYMYILAIRNTYTFPKDLLRQVLGATP